MKKICILFIITLFSIISWAYAKWIWISSFETRIHQPGYAGE